MAENITRCPKCSTSFRISEKHLNSGKGAVRCGSCLNVFIARDFLVETKSIDEKASLAESGAESTHTTETGEDGTAANHLPSKTGEATQSVKADPEEMLISDDMDRTTDDPEAMHQDMRLDIDDAFTKENNPRDYEFNLFERESQLEEEEPVVPEDESWALDLLENDNDEEFRRDSTDAYEEEELQATEEFDDSYYKNSFKLVDDTEIETAQSEKDVAFTEEDSESYESDTPEIEEFDYSELPQQTFGSNSMASERYLDSIEPEPVEFNWHQRTSFWHARGFWTGLSLLAGIALFAQVAWVKFDTLSVSKPYRPYYAKACSILNCELPPQVNVRKIRTANLVVRTHPRVKGALIVDAVLQNTAKFQQKYPVLDLVFTDSQDKVVAAKRLKPSDYLRGELSGKTVMPTNQPIHIAIELADPGSHATGYKMTIAQ